MSKVKVDHFQVNKTKDKINQTILGEYDNLEEALNEILKEFWSHGLFDNLADCPQYPVIFWEYNEILKQFSYLGTLIGIDGKDTHGNVLFTNHVGKQRTFYVSYQFNEYGEWITTIVDEQTND